MNVAEFEELWTVVGKSAGRKAGELLEELAEQIGLSIESSDPEPLRRPVDVDLNGKTVLEAIEAVCHEIECQPVYPKVYAGTPNDEGPIVLKNGRRTLPVATAGPFLIYVTDLVEQAPDGIGHLKIEARAHGMPREALLHEWVGDTTAHPLAIDSVTGPSGTSLLESGSSQGRPLPNVAVASCLDYFRAPLQGLTRSVTSFRVTGAATFPLAHEVTAHDWTDLRENATVQVGGVDVSLDTMKVNEDPDPPEIYFDVRCGDFPVHRVQCIPLDSQGQPLEVVRAPSVRNNARLHCTGRVATLRVHVVESEIEVRYPFQFDVPLSQAGNQSPDDGRRLDLSEPPMTAELLGAESSGGSKPRVRFSNAANVDVRSYTFLINYFRAGGEFEDFDMVTIDDFDRNTLLWTPVLEAGGTIERTLDEYNPSPATATATVQMDEVEFMNGQKWQRHP